MTHTARFPGTINDPSKETVSERQAKRLATLTRQPTAAFKGKTLGELRRADLHLDPSLFLARTICGRVVKTDADGKDHPVPFATVNVYDTDLGLLGWSRLYNGQHYASDVLAGYLNGSLAALIALRATRPGDEAADA